VPSQGFYTAGALDNLATSIATSGSLVRLDRYAYDTLQRPIAHEHPDPDGLGPRKPLVKEMYYDRLGRVVRQREFSTDALQPIDLQTDYLYDGRGLLTDVIAPVDSEGNRTVASQRYDVNGSMYYESRGFVTAASPGEPTIISDNTYLLDNLGRRYGTVSPLQQDGRRTTTREYHDAVGNVVRQINALGSVTTHTFDDLGRRRQTVETIREARLTNSAPVFDIPVTTTYDYNASGALVGQSVQTISRSGGYGGNPETQSTEYQYDALGRVVASIGANFPNRDRITRYQYDSWGNRTATTDPNGDVTNYAYDQLGQITSETIFFGGRSYVRRNDYDPFGNLTQSVDRIGRVIRRQFDALGQPIKEEWFTNTTVVTPTYTSQFDHTASGQLKTARDTVGAAAVMNSHVTHDFDRADRVARIDTAFRQLGTHNWSLQYDRDPLGRTENRTIQYGTTVTMQDSYRFDASNRVVGVQTSNQSTQPNVSGRRADTSLTYDAGLLTGIDYSDAISNEPMKQSARSTYNYYNDGRARLIEHFVGPNSTNQSLVDAVSTFYSTRGTTHSQYSFNTSQTTPFDHDQLNQLTQEGNVQFSYDAAGNRGKSAPYGRMAYDPFGSYQYDAEGNVIYRELYQTQFTAQPRGLWGVPLGRKLAEGTVQQGWHRLRLENIRLNTAGADSMLIEVVGVGRTYLSTSTPLLSGGEINLSDLTWDFYANVSGQIQVNIYLHQRGLSIGGWGVTQIDVSVDKLREVQKLQWNHRNQITRIETFVTNGPDGLSPPDVVPTKTAFPFVTVKYLYDALGQWIGRKQTGTPRVSPSDTEIYVNESGRQTAIFDRRGMAEQHLVYAPDTGRLLAVQAFALPIGSKTIFTLTDQQGNPVFAAQRLSNEVVDRQVLSTDAWGVPKGSIEFTDPNSILNAIRHRQFGGLYDSGVGIYFLDGQPYAPEAGRWMTEQVGARMRGDNPYTLSGNAPDRLTGAGVTSTSAGLGTYDDSQAPGFMYYASPKQQWERGNYFTAILYGTGQVTAVVAGAAALAVAAVTTGAAAAIGTAVSSAAGKITVAGATAYVGKQIIVSAAETAVAAKISQLSGDESFSVWGEAGRNFGFNFTMGLLPGVGEARFAAKAGRAVRAVANYGKHYAYEVATATAFDTGWEMGVNGRSFQDAFTQAGVGNVLGQGVGDTLSAGLRTGLRRANIPIFGRLCFTGETLVHLRDSIEEIRSIPLGARVADERPLVLSDLAHAACSTHDSLASLQHLALTASTSNASSSSLPLIASPVTDASLAIAHDTKTLHYRLVLHPLDPAQADVEISLLRDQSWLDAHRAELGAIIDVDLPELSLHGQAIVVLVEPYGHFDPLEPGLITGRFEHLAPELLELYVDRLATPIRCTPRHPFYSLTRRVFIEARDLPPGELLDSPTGPIRVLSHSLVPEPHRVYNLEVHDHHTYRITPLALLVHNSSVQGNAAVSDATISLRMVDGMSSVEFAKKARALQELGDQGMLVRAANSVARDPSVTNAYRQDMIRRIWAQYGTQNRELANKLIDRVTRRMSPDHVHELQLGGADAASNLRFLDRFTNWHVGTQQIRPQLRNLPVGTTIRIKIE
jgi:YD repeat-containing protein